MAENKRNFSEPRDYKERFEFKLTIGENVICARYFRIPDFNEMSLSSYELAECVRDCALMIDNDLKGKTATYLEMMAPRIFQNEKELKSFLKKKSNRDSLHVGEGLVTRDPNEKNFIWKGDGKYEEADFTDEDFIRPVTKDDVYTYKLSFLDNGREVVSTIWDGIYPKLIRKSIDLSNRCPRFEKPNEPFTLGFESYLRYRMNNGGGDLIFKIIRRICDTCGYEKGHWYATNDEYRREDGTKIKYENKSVLLNRLYMEKNLRQE